MENQTRIMIVKIQMERPLADKIQAPMTIGKQGFLIANLFNTTNL